MSVLGLIIFIVGFDFSSVSLNVKMLLSVLFEILVCLIYVVVASSFSFFVSLFFLPQHEYNIVINPIPSMQDKITTMTIVSVVDDFLDISIVSPYHVSTLYSLSADLSYE